MILSRRLDILNLKDGSEYTKYFKGLDKVIAKLSPEDYKKAYTDTYCIDSSWVPLYLIVYIPKQNEAEVIYSGKNCEVINEHALNEAKDVLENFMKRMYTVHGE